MAGMACVILAAISVSYALSVAGPPARFPHATHVEEGLECLDCHEGVDQAVILGTPVYPAIDVCQECHEDADLTEYGYATMPKVPRPILRFSHKMHLEVEDTECATCHGSFSNAAADTDSIMVAGLGAPGHDVCGACHAETDAASECGQCHLELAALLPLDHERDYLHTHQFNARETANCVACHGQSDNCVQCHHGENIDFLSHNRIWLYEHAQTSMKQFTECATCHDSETFCTPCHQEAGVKPSDHLNAASWISPGNLHGVEARRDIEQCASCHEDADPLCVSCHRDWDDRLGTQRSIHADDWRSTGWNGPWHQDDGWNCYMCHPSSTTQEGKGFCTYCHR